MQENTTTHGTFVALGDIGALLRGAPGAGKSDLALRFIFAPHTHFEGVPVLIADDQVILRKLADRVEGSCPEPLRGKIEVRGLGILRAPLVRSKARLSLIVDLVEHERIKRLPEPPRAELILGCAIPRVDLFAFEASAPIKLALAIEQFALHS